MAQTAALQLIDTCAVDWLVSAGVSGGLRPGLPIGALIEAACVIDNSGHQWDALALPAPALTRGAAPEPPDVSGGTVYCSKLILSSPADKAAAFSRCHADAADMESAGVAQTALERGIPFSCIRALSDAAEDSLPMDFTPFIDTAGRVQIAPLALRVLRDPWKIPPLIRLAGHTSLASRRLASYLVAVVGGV